MYRFESRAFDLVDTIAASRERRSCLAGFWSRVLFFSSVVTSCDLLIFRPLRYTRRRGAAATTQAKAWVLLKRDERQVDTSARAVRQSAQRERRHNGKVRCWALRPNSRVRTLQIFADLQLRVCINCGPLLTLTPTLTLTLLERYFLPRRDSLHT